MTMGYEACAGCADPVIRGSQDSDNIFCGWCQELANELGIDLSEPDQVSWDDTCRLAAMCEATIG